MSGEELWECVKNMLKATDGPKNLVIRHNLDVMHIEKNFFD